MKVGCTNKDTGETLLYPQCPQIVIVHLVSTKQLSGCKSINLPSTLK